MGRPTKRTPEVEATIIRALECGNKKPEACKIAGVAYSTVRDWLSQDEDFSARVEMAAASVGNRAWATMIRLLDSADDNVAHRTSAWILDRKNLAGPDEDALEAELAERVGAAREIYARMEGTVPAEDGPTGHDPAGPPSD